MTRSTARAAPRIALLVGRRAVLRGGWLGRRLGGGGQASAARYRCPSALPTAALRVTPLCRIVVADPGTGT